MAFFTGAGLAVKSMPLEKPLKKTLTHRNDKGGQLIPAFFSSSSLLSEESLSLALLAADAAGDF